MTCLKGQSALNKFLDNTEPEGVADTPEGCVDV